jgi:hypothetical protein
MLRVLARFGIKEWVNVMANEQQVAILKAGRDRWNAWRQSHPDTRIELVGADLSRARLDGVILDRADLSQCNARATWFVGARFCDADMQNADFRDAHLDRAVFRHANAAYADFSSASLSESTIGWAVIAGSRFCAANLRAANLAGSYLSGVDLTEANLTDANLSQVHFERPKLAGADLSGATLNQTVFSNADLSRVKGLETCNHRDASVLDHRTLMKSRNLPLPFLHGCGLPDRLIEYLPSLTGEVIQLYSCFISFTESDDEIAAQLYNDLQGKGVRCWRWKEDARGGRSLIGEVDSAVRVYDKLLVICSESALRSGPVIREIERALQREDELTRNGEEAEVLFPIRIDDAIFNWEHPRKRDVTSKVISDFRGWKDRDKFSAAFIKLLRDLKINMPPQ